MELCGRGGLTLFGSFLLLFTIPYHSCIIELKESSKKEGTRVVYKRTSMLVKRESDGPTIASNLQSKYPISDIRYNPVDIPISLKIKVANLLRQSSKQHFWDLAA